MIRYVLAALVGVALLVALGFAVQRHWFAAEPVTRVAPPPVAETPPHAATAPVVVPHDVALLEVKGRVEKRTGSVWTPVHAGDHLNAQDTIRTGTDAFARIEIGSGVLIDHSTEITVGEITTTVSELSLTEGRVKATTNASGATIRIATRGTEAIAEATNATFDVASHGGKVVVAAEQGEVHLGAHGRDVKIAAGSQSLVTATEGPSVPSAIPGSLFLKVSAASDAHGKAAIRGESAAGATVSINGVVSTADATGAFTGGVRLAKGENVIVVSVEDALGRQKQTVIRKMVAAAPRLETEVQWQ